MDPAYGLGGVSWSDDGRNLMFTGRTSPPTADADCCTTSLWTIDAAGGHQRLLVDDVSDFNIAGPTATNHGP